MTQEWTKGRREGAKEHECAQGRERRRHDRHDMTDWESMDKYDKRGEYRMKHEKNKTQELTQPT